MGKLTLYLLLFSFCTGCQPSEEITSISNTQKSTILDPAFSPAIANPKKPIPKPHRTVHYRITLVDDYDNPDICRINNVGDIFVDGEFFHKGHQVALESKSPDPTRPSTMQCDFNDRGEVIGNLTGSVSGAYTVFFSQAVIWRHGHLSILPQPPSGGETVAVRINDVGDVLINTFENTAAIDPTSHRAFLLSRQGQMIDIGIGTALCLNNRRQVLLQRTIEEQIALAPKQTNGEKRVDLSHDQFLWERGHIVPIALTENCEAILMNDRNQMIGQEDMGQPSKYWDYSHITHGFVWSAGHLETIKSLGWESSHALGINNQGQVVGSADVSVPDSAGNEKTHAFLYSHGKLSDLNFEIPAQSGWILTKASDINDRGQIVGVGNKGVFLLTPIKKEK